MCVQVEFGLPELEGRTHIFKIHTKTMSVDKDIRYELIARLCPSSTGAEIRWGGAHDGLAPFGGPGLRTHTPLWGFSLWC